MNAKRRALRRRQLDRQAQQINAAKLPDPPRGGWIEAVRESLGMSLDAFGRRMGVTRQSAHQLERAEVNGSLTLKRLRTAADALDCDVVVLVVPRVSLEESVRKRAVDLARADAARTGHSMALERQSITDEHLAQMIEEIADEIIERGDLRLWA